MPASHLATGGTLALGKVLLVKKEKKIRDKGQRAGCMHLKSALRLRTFIFQRMCSAIYNAVTS